MKNMIFFLSLVVTGILRATNMNHLQKHMEGMLIFGDMIKMNMSHAKHKNLLFRSSILMKSESPRVFVVEYYNANGKGCLRFHTCKHDQQFSEISNRSEMYEKQVGQSQIDDVKNVLQIQKPLHYYSFAKDNVGNKEIVVRQDTQTKQIRGVMMAMTDIVPYEPFVHKHVGCFRYFAAEETAEAEVSANLGISSTLSGSKRSVSQASYLTRTPFKGIDLGLKNCARACESEYSFMGYQNNKCFCGNYLSYHNKLKNKDCRDGIGGDSGMDVYSLKHVSWPIRIIEKWNDGNDRGSLKRFHCMDNISLMLLENGAEFDGKYSSYGIDLRWPSALEYAFQHYGDMIKTTLFLLEKETNRAVLESVFERAFKRENMRVVTFMLKNRQFEPFHTWKKKLRERVKSRNNPFDRSSLLKEKVHVPTEPFMKFLLSWDNAKSFLELDWYNIDLIIELMPWIRLCDSAAEFIFYIYPNMKTFIMPLLEKETNEIVLERVFKKAFQREDNQVLEFLVENRSFSPFHVWKMNWNLYHMYKFPTAAFMEFLLRFDDGKPLLKMEKFLEERCHKKHICWNNETIPLSQAILEQRYDIARLMIEAGSNVETDSMEPLHQLVKNNAEFREYVKQKVFEARKNKKSAKREEQKYKKKEKTNKDLKKRKRENSFDQL